MSTHPDLPAEQAYIDRAYERLEAMRESARQMIRAVIGLGKGGTHQAREERDVIVRTSLQRLERLDIGREALCFGRIDRAGEPGTAEGVESFYIGRLGVSGEHHEPLVVDWRAPVAEPFYRATGAHPMGLARRRHFLTDDRRLVAIEDELFGEGHIGDAEPGGALVSAMERSRTGRMRDIVATIQREQDEIIRGPLPGVMVVQGGPGTGKTAVALHRAAYLLYTHRFPLERQGVLVVGPNPVFLRYIEQVLPSLGESGAVLTTLGGLVTEARVKAVDPPATAALKGDGRMARLIARAVKDRQRPLRAPVEVGVGGHLLRLTPEDSAVVVAAARRRHGPHNSRRRHVEAHVAQILYQRYLESVERSRLARAGAADPEEAPAGEADEQRRALRRHPAVVAALDRMWPRLLPEELIHDLFGAPALLALAGRSLLSEEELRLLHRPRSDSLETIPWTAADLPLIDEAKVLLGPVRLPPEGDAGPRTYGHIVVDEAQDLSPMQLRMLARRSISGSMTVVGDVAQATGSRAPSGWDDVLAYLSPRRPATVAQLSVNYRTPSEVMEVAVRVLASADPGLTAPTSVRSTGIPPRAVGVDGTDLATTVAEVARAEAAEVGGGTVAILCPDSWVGDLAPDLAGAGLEFALGEVDGLDQAVTLLPVGVAKGLEFDSVVLVEPAAVLDDAVQGMRALYVALTRTTRRLTVVHSRPLPAELAGLAGRDEAAAPATTGW
ncbi:MAG TPA: ATP-binding domain-containing protein [Acidimicrobiales bacterium]|nr:ATP-binding domain-containing protein [Acidimicrobiales bacterium]